MICFQCEFPRKQQDQKVEKGLKLLKTKTLISKSRE